MIWLAISVVVVSWWLFTGVALWAAHQPRDLRRLFFAGLSALALVALWLVPTIGSELSTRGTLLGFLIGLVLWSWLELSYLFGFLTGPVSEPCPPTASLATRLQGAVGTTLYHELAVIFVVGLVCLLAMGRDNQTVTHTLTILWLMRWSAKINLFSGVRTYNGSWLPRHLQHIDSYLRVGQNTWLVYASLVAGIFCSVMLFQVASTAENPSLQLSYWFALVLLVLGTLEHLFLMVPSREAVLWRWAKAPELGENQT